MGHKFTQLLDETGGAGKGMRDAPVAHFGDTGNKIWEGQTKMKTVFSSAPQRPHHLFMHFTR